MTASRSHPAAAPGTCSGPGPGRGPDVSIIVVSWNTRDLLLECLESIRRHVDPARREVLVVDNASRDGSAEAVAARFPEVRLLRNGRNVGFAAANNRAMRLARGRYLLLLNSDARLRDEAVAACIERADACPRTAAIGCRLVHPDGTLQPTPCRFPELLDLAAAAIGAHRLPWPRRLSRVSMPHWQRDDERDVDVVSGCFMLVRRAAIDEVGPLDERYFFYGEETDWCARFRAAGWRVRFAPVGEVVHHGGASAERLDERRRLLLAEALVRLQLDHRGRSRAVAAWLLLALSHLLRAAWWLLPRRRAERLAARRRSQEHRRVLRRFAEAWPRNPRSRSRSGTDRSARAADNRPARA